MAGTIKSWLSHNKGTKIISVVLAIISWYAIQEAISFESVINDVPLSIQTDEGWAILDVSLESVDVLFRGSKESVRDLLKDQISVEVDLRGRQHGGELTLTLDPAMVNVPAGPNAVEVRPKELIISLDQKQQKSVSIKANIQGDPPTGYELVKAVCSPPSVELTGPRMRLAEVETLRTAPLDLEGRLGSFKLRMEVAVPDMNWSVDPEKVTVEVEIIEHAATREMMKLPLGAIVPEGVNTRVDLVPAAVDIVLKGREELLDTLTKSDISVYVDCSLLDKAARYDLPVRVHAPTGVDVIEIKPATIDVTIGQL